MTTLDTTEKENHAAHKEFEGRIRDVEVGQATLVSAVKSIDQNFAEMKIIFQKSVDQTNATNLVLADRYNDMYQRFLIVEHDCQQCDLTDVEERVNKIEGDRLTKIEDTIKELSTHRNKLIVGTWEVTKPILIAFLIYLFIVILSHVNLNNTLLQTAPGIKTEIEIEHTLNSHEAEASQVFTQYTSIGRKIKHAK